jgi:protein-arginine kinase activator protein McsA
MKKYKKVTCNKCNYVHFSVTREYAEDEVKRFNDYFNALSLEKQYLYYGGKGSDIKQYEQCMVCSNSYKDFRLSKPGDCPNGCTISPIIRSKD